MLHYFLLLHWSITPGHYCRRISLPSLHDAGAVTPGHKATPFAKKPVSTLLQNGQDRLSCFTQRASSPDVSS